MTSIYKYLYLKGLSSLTQLCTLIVITLLLLNACQRPNDPTKELDLTLTFQKERLDQYTNTTQVSTRFKEQLSSARQVDSLIFLTKLLKNYDERLTIVL